MHDDVFWLAMKNTFVYAILVTVMKNVIALALAYVLARKFPLRTLFRTGIYMPVTLSYVVIGALWTWIYNPTFGLLNALLKALGLEHLIVGWLSDSRVALYSVVAVDVWKWIGYHMCCIWQACRPSPRICMRQPLWMGPTVGRSL